MAATRSLAKLCNDTRRSPSVHHKATFDLSTLCNRMQQVAMVVGTSATWCCHEQCWGSHTFVALPNCLQWQSSSQPPWTWAKGVESRRIVRNETYQIYSKPWTSNGPITIHYLLNESCKPKCSWGISNSRLWPERPITQQLTIAMMGKLQSSEQVWDSLSRPVRSVYNRRPIK